MQEPVIGGATKPAATRQSHHLPLERGWSEGQGEEGGRPHPGLLGSEV